MNNKNVMSSDAENTHVVSKDSSVNDARWMLYSVIILGLAVFSLGLIADSVTSVQAQDQAVLIQE